MTQANTNGARNAKDRPLAFVPSQRQNTRNNNSPSGAISYPWGCVGAAAIAE